jgi:hypothetical protein
MRTARARFSKSFTRQISRTPLRRVAYSQHRFSRFAKELSQAVDAMRFRIIEPTFFLHKQRRVGEIMEAPVGPYRNVAGAFGLQRIPQFVEMPDEIKDTIVNAAQGVLPEQGQAGQAVNALTPPPIKLAPKANPLAARIRALTTRRAKFQDEAAVILSQGESAMTQVEATGPVVLKRAHQASFDELTAITDLATSLKELDATNGGPLEG